MKQLQQNNSKNIWTGVAIGIGRQSEQSIYFVTWPVFMFTTSIHYGIFWVCGQAEAEELDSKQYRDYEIY